MSDELLLDRDAIRELFRALGDRLSRRGVVGQLYVVGGAAMALAYDARRATRDIDALLVPHGVVRQEAEALAVERGLPAWWLNEQASVYVAGQGDPAAPVTFDHPGLKVSVASPEHLLAMKVLASRRRDLTDIAVLVDQLGLTSVEGVLSICRHVFPQEEVPARARLALEDLFAEQ